MFSPTEYTAVLIATLATQIHLTNMPKNNVFFKTTNSTQAAANWNLGKDYQLVRSNS